MTPISQEQAIKSIVYNIVFAKIFVHQLTFQSNTAFDDNPIFSLCIYNKKVCNVVLENDMILLPKDFQDCYLNKNRPKDQEKKKSTAVKLCCKQEWDKWFLRYLLGHIYWDSEMYFSNVVDQCFSTWFSRGTLLSDENIIGTIWATKNLLRKPFSAWNNVSVSLCYTALFDSLSQSIKH